MKKLLSLVAVVASICASINADTVGVQEVINKPLPTAMLVEQVSVPKLSDNTYNRVRILTELAKVKWFIEKHAKPDAIKANDLALVKQLDLLALSIAGHAAELESTTCK